MYKWMNKKGNERGTILITALIALAVGALVIVPTAALMTTGLKAGAIVEEQTDLLYAADAGVESAIWEISQTDPDATKVPGTVGSSGQTYQLTINDITVYITITLVNTTTYKIESAASDGTTIISYITFGRSFLDNAISSPGGVTIKPGVTINGDVQTSSSGYDNKGTVNGDFVEWDVDYWNALIAILPDFYSDQISGDSSYSSTTYTVSGTTTFPNSNTTGDLKITGTGVLNLNDILYVNGDLTFSGKNWTLNLNGNTIFVNGSITNSPSSPSQINGPGCIIAVDDLWFQPNSTSSGYIFLMSMNGTVHIQPTSGEFYGSIAGTVSVELWGKPVINWSSPSALNFPDLTQLIKENSVAKILTWNVS